MCTSIIANKRKTLVGWNLDILNMEYRVSATENGVYIEILDAKEGWMPLFGANRMGGFVGMPTCWPFDVRSDPPAAGADNCEGSNTTPAAPADIGKGAHAAPSEAAGNCDTARASVAGAAGTRDAANISPSPQTAPQGQNILLLDIDYLTMQKDLAEIRRLAEAGPVFSEPGVTFMSALSDAEGNMLHIVPGQGIRYYEKPEYAVLTNFSPFKGESESHPWMGADRYHRAEDMLKKAGPDFDVEDCFAILRAVAQEACPTVVSMVFDVTERTVYWCENRRWGDVRRQILRG